MSRLCQPPARAEYRKGKFDDWFWQFSIKGVNVNFLSIFQFISDDSARLSALLNRTVLHQLMYIHPVSKVYTYKLCVFSLYLKHQSLGLIGVRSSPSCPRLNILAPPLPPPPLCHYRNRGDNFRFKISKSRKGLRWQNYHLNRGDPFVGRDWRANNCK